MNKLVRKNKKGFTLTEMIVVIAIIGILAAVLIPSIIGYVKHAQKSAALQEATTVLEIYETYQTELEAGLIKPDSNNAVTAFSTYYLEITGKQLEQNKVYIEYQQVNNAPDTLGQEDAEAKSFVYIADKITVVIDLETKDAAYENKDYVNPNATLFSYQISGSTEHYVLKFKEIDQAS